MGYGFISVAASPTIYVLFPVCSRTTSPNLIANASFVEIENRVM
jgi:hypothetical protein